MGERKGNKILEGQGSGWVSKHAIILHVPTSYYTISLMFI